MWGAVGAAGLMIAIAALIPPPVPSGATAATVAWLGAVHAYVDALETSRADGPAAVHARLTIAADPDGSIRSAPSVGAAMLRVLEGGDGPHTVAWSARWPRRAPSPVEPTE